MAGGRPNARVLALVGALWAIASPAHALDFGWDAPAGCPSADFVEGEVTRIVGRPWGELGAALRQTHGVITAEADGTFRLRLRVVSAAGATSERNVTASSCTEATEAAVAILVAGIAPGAASADQTPSVASDTTVVPEAAPAVPAAAPPAPSADAGVDGSEGTLPDAPLAPVVAAQLGADVGSLVAVVPRVQLSAGMGSDRFELMGFVAAAGRAEGNVVGTAAGARMYLLTGGAMCCYRATLTRPAISACAGLEVGSLEASGFGASDGRDARALWSAALAGGVLDWDITEQAFASVGVSAVVPLLRPRVVLSPVEVHRVSSVAVRPFLGLGLRFR